MANLSLGINKILLILFILIWLEIEKFAEEILTTPISNPSEILEFNEYIDVINHFIDSGWTDGLPIIPPTQELVDNFINSSVLSSFFFIIANGKI